MIRSRQVTFDSLAHAAWMFAAWAAVRIMVWMYMQREVAYPDAFLNAVTDVEIHSLRFRWGWDLALMLLFALVVAVAQKIQRRRVLVPTVVSTLLATTLAMAMVIYPALTLSGRIASPFTGAGGTLSESIAFAIVGTVALAVAAGLVRNRRSADIG